MTEQTAKKAAITAPKEEDLQASDAPEDLQAPKEEKKRPPFYHRQQEELTWDSQGGTRCLGCMYCTMPNGRPYNPLTNGR